MFTLPNHTNFYCLSFHISAIYLLESHLHSLKTLVLSTSSPGINTSVMSASMKMFHPIFHSASQFFDLKPNNLHLQSTLVTYPHTKLYHNVSRTTTKIYYYPFFVMTPYFSSFLMPSTPTSYSCSLTSEAFNTLIVHF